MKEYLFHMKTVIKTIKIEVTLLFVLIILSLLIYTLPALHQSVEHLKKCLIIYFSSDRLNLIANISMILLGVYGTITSVFGASRSMATSRLAKKDLTKDFIITICSAMVSALCLAVYVAFVNKNAIMYFLLLIGLILWVFVGLIKFLILILLMYHHNISTSLAVEKNEDDRYEELMNVLVEISIELKNMSHDEKR